MKILVVGGGGREHAICWKLRQSRLVSTIFCAPGNPGTARVAENVNIRVDQVQALLEFAEQQAVDLTIVGPELPLTLGIVDIFSAAGKKIWGPSKYAAQLESSKSFAKEVMRAAGVPTAEYQACTSEQELLKFIAGNPGPIVLKADGLAAGKGVFVCRNSDEARLAVPALFHELKSERVVAEQFLEGVEASFIVVTNGRLAVPLATAHDYKRIFDNDEGPNTGGMGTVSPTSHLPQGSETWVVQHVIEPVLKEMERRGHPFQGFLYAGLMIAPDGRINVLEFNARLGDPETQSIMRRLDSDLAELLIKLMDAEMPAVSWSADSAVCVVLAAPGYPGSLRLGDSISGIEFAENIPGVVVFHAGTALQGPGTLVTAGGRVLNVTAQGCDLPQACGQVYRAADMIQFAGRQLRRDIGKN